MKVIATILLAILFSGCVSAPSELADEPQAEDQSANKDEDYNDLSPFEESVIIGKNTEPPGTGEYYEFFEDGVYLCKRCDNVLYRSDDKFHSGSGWASFDQSVFGGVEQISILSGFGIEIVCSNCGGHLGHVFFGENYTPRDTRYCVNSASMNFIFDDSEGDAETDNFRNFERAIFALGCFWGAEYSFKNTDGVVATTTGYTGGTTTYPSYSIVSSHTSGHAEAVEVIFDRDLITYDELVRLFFSLHDPSDTTRQGDDNDGQYRSAIFYTNQQQMQTAQEIISTLENQGTEILTQVAEADIFWQAEDFHQDYIQ